MPSSHPLMTYPMPTMKSRKSIISVVDDNGVPFIGYLRNRISKIKMKKYLEKRDEYRRMRGGVGIWEGSSFHMIHKMVGKKKYTGR